MAIETVGQNNIRVNTDPQFFAPGAPRTLVRRLQEIGANAKSVGADSSVFTNMIKSLHHEHGALFPSLYVYTVEWPPSIQTNQLQRKLEAEFPLIDEFKKSSLFEQANRIQRRRIRKAALAVALSTTAKHTSEIDLNVWKAFISPLRIEDGTRFREDLGIHDMVISALRGVAKILDEKNHQAGYLSLVKVRRLGKIFSTHAGGLDVFEVCPTELQQWLDLLNAWLRQIAIKCTKGIRTAFRLFCYWLTTYPSEVYQLPTTFLSVARTNPSFPEFLLSQNCTENTLVQHVGYMRRFVDFLREDIFATPASRNGSESYQIQPLVTRREYQELLATRRFTSTKPSEAVTIPIPTKYLTLARKILEENDYAWPKSLENQWFRVFDRKKKAYIDQWCPSITFVFLTLLELPIRSIQVRCLDSGEGDEFRYLPTQNRWIKNDGPHANYWRNDYTCSVLNRGAVHRVIYDGQARASIYINTNKTTDRKNKFDEHSGYIIPWQNEYLIRLFSELRLWQERYNTVLGPTEYRDLPSGTFESRANRPSEAALASIPARFYLFRIPAKGRRDTNTAPPSYGMCNNFFHAWMSELENRLKQQDDDIQIVTKRDSGGAAIASIFSMHGLRTTGLTAFAEAGVPIDILSKLVAGHSSILMTLHYLKFRPGHITDLLTEAREKIEANATDNLRRFLADASHDEASRIAVAASEFTLQNRTTPALISDMGIGFCPYGGTRCSDGGPVLKRDKSGQDIFGAVPGGAGHCLQCRHFVTGEPFLLPLWIKCEQLLAAISDQARLIEQETETLTELQNELYRSHKLQGQPDEIAALRRRVRVLESRQDIEPRKLDQLMLDLHAAFRYFTAVLNLNHVESRDDDSTKNQLLSPQSIDFAGFEEGSRFEQIDRVVQGSRLYPILHDERLEQERDAFIDNILYHNSFQPLAMAPLDTATKQRAADALAKYLLINVGAVECERLAHRTVTLEDLGLDLEIGSLLAAHQNITIAQQTSNSHGPKNAIT